jgi:hypothetical protein
MDCELKVHWVAALRSKKYTQGRGNLHKRTNGELYYCCIGALCDIINPSWKYSLDNVGGWWNGSLYGIDTDTLHSIGLSESDQTVLIEMNDRKSCSFEEIASYIENTL